MAIIYARQSKDIRSDEAAVNRQVAECEDLAQRLGLTVTANLVDNDRSASKGDRPGFNALVKAVSEGRDDTVIVWATDRLYRRLRDLVQLVELAEKTNLKILTVKSGDLDLSTPAGRMLAGMLGSAARYEVEQKGARQVVANAHRAKRGDWQFSRRPYGYRREKVVDASGKVTDTRVVIVPEEAALLREGYERSLAGESGYSIVADWTARGLTAMGGRPWSITQLRARLANPHYAGLVVHQGEVVGEGVHEPIVDRADYEAFVQGARARAARKTSDNRVKYLLSGIAECGECGARMFARPDYRPGGRKVMTYQCTTCWGVSRALLPVDEVVTGAIVARLSMPDAAELLSPAVEVAPLMEEAVTIRERRDDLAALLAEGVLTRAAVREQSERLGARLAELETEIGNAQGVGPLGALIGAEDVAARWNAAPLAAQRDLIRGMCAVTIRRQASTRVFDHDAIEVVWRGPAN